MQTSLSQFFSTPRASTLSAKMMAQIEQRQSKTTPRRKKGPKLKSIENSGASSTPPPKFEQLIMDLGQKNIGVQHCTKVRGKNNTWTCGHCIECGMVYSQENPSDVKQHEKYHNRFEEIRNFRVTASQLNSWTKNLPYEDITAPIPGILFTIKPNSKATLRRKLDDILTNFVNEELGLQNDHQKALDSSDEEQRHAFVFIAETSHSNDRNSLQTSSSVSSSSSSANGGPAFIAGILLIGYVEEIICMPEEKHFKGKFLGVDRIWVHSFHRHKGIATFMLDSARRLMANSTDQFSRLRVAFSDPSNLGIKLAISYANQHQTKDKENINTRSRYLIYTPAIPNTAVGRADALIKKLSNTNSTKTNSSGSPEL